MRYTNLEGHTHDLWMLVDVDIIMRVFMKKIDTKCL